MRVVEADGWTSRERSIALHLSAAGTTDGNLEAVPPYLRESGGRPSGITQEHQRAYVELDRFSP